MPTPPTSTPWVPIFDTRAKIQVPTPVNGKWARAASGAVAWQDIPGFQAPDAGWQIIGSGGAIPYQNGWTDWPDAPYTPCRFRKLSDGLVILEGLIGNAGTDSAAAFTLPVGYRPSLSQTGTVQIFHRFTAGSYAPVWGNFWVYADGQVMPSTAGAGRWISLNNIKFYAGG